MGTALQHEAVGRSRSGFEREFGAAPIVTASAPGRVNLIGEHTDYNDGFVLPMAIDAWCACAAGTESAASRAPTGCGPSGLLRLAALDVGERVELVCRPEAWAAAAGESAPGSWWRYVVGVLAGVAGLVRPGAHLSPLDVCLASSVPLGAGLSSSAALEVAVAVAACRAWAVEGVSGLDLARLCQRAEHGFAGVPCGLMDQCASIMSRAGHALLLDCRSMDSRHVPVPSDWAVVIVNTGVRHALATGEYARRRDECQAACAALGVRSLRDAARGRVEALGDARTRRRARHVVSENARVLEFADALAARDGERAGRLMAESHSSLRDDYEVSCAELDAAVEGLRQMRGVVGARMTGGGFGGSAIALVDRGRAGRVASEALATGLGTSARIAEPVDGACTPGGVGAV